MNLHLLALVVFLSSPFGICFDPPTGNSPESSLNLKGVGIATDPSGDCQLNGDATRLTIAIPAGDHALDIEQDRMNAPRVLQEVTGDFVAQVTVTGDYPQNTVTEVEGCRPFQGAGLLLWVSPRTYIRLERAQVKMEKDGKPRHFTYPSWELRSEDRFLRIANGNDGLVSGPSTTLRLSRAGDKFVAAISENGSDWRELDPITIKLPEKAQIGVSASHNTTSPFETTLTNFLLTTVPKENK